MCLIIFSPNGSLIPHSHFKEGAKDNEDGIGIMSEDGVEKFLGRKATKRAWRYARYLAERSIPYAVHFRFATHGRISRDNTHPFEIPGTEAYMMHNGILWTSALATEEESDTAVFARNIMPAYWQAKLAGTPEWKQRLETESSYNKLLVFDAYDATWHLVNEDLGDWLGGLWYSNLHSVPWADLPAPVKAARSKRHYFMKGPLSIPAQPMGALPSGPTLRADTDEDALEDWYAKVRQREEARQQARTGFDWHDRASWDQYPIPGSWEDRAQQHIDDYLDGTDQFI